jgi:DNA-binding response OmpR family regulator
LFLTEAGQPLTRSQLVLRMALREHQSDQRAVDMLISRLRKRLDDPTATESMIRTLRGIGYVFVAEVVTEQSV